MKFLREKSIRQIGMYLLILMFAIYLSEYFIIRDKINTLDEVEQKLDFSRSTQLSAQQISLLTQRFHPNDSVLATDIEARIEHQDHLLTILGDGGRIDRTEVFLKPLSRLPRISYDNLKGYWNEYKKSVTALLVTSKDTVEVFVAPPIVMDTSSISDSTTTVASVATLPSSPVNNAHTKLAQIRLKQESSWLTQSYWYDNLFNDLEHEVTLKKASLNQWVIAIILFDIALLIVIFYGLVKYILNPIGQLEINTAGHIQDFGFPKNEIGSLANQINETLENLKDATEFVTSIGQGNLSIDYRETLDSGYVHGKNKLADSLIDMQGKLKNLNEEESKRQWVNEGLAKFVDILRSSNDDLGLLGDRIVAALAQYTKSNQGALYILNDENESNKYLDLISLFAFDLKKFEQRKIKVGEGLLGQTFLEKETNHYTNFPDEYIRITSGLGDANPRSLLIVPLKIDKEVLGIIELASFNDYQPYVIAFVEKLGETIASTIASVQAAQKNKYLIEQFQQQTEQMRAQEEEMRQNMEELQATQEEIARKERGYIERIQQLEEQVGNPLSSEMSAQTKQSFDQLERKNATKISLLEKQLSQKSIPGDDWALASEVEKTLRINLEALKITQQEFDRR